MANLIVILGPTASGKTKLAARLAAALDTEIIGADSRQVYAEMNIGTGKDLNEFLVDGKNISYHLIDIVPVGSSYHVYDFQNDFEVAFDLITSKSKIPILVGGTGMYIDAVLKNYQYTSIPIDSFLRSELESKSIEFIVKMFHSYNTALFPHADLSTKKRAIRAVEIVKFLTTNGLVSKNRDKIQPIIFGLHMDSEIRKSRIQKRLHDRLQNGLVNEVERLLEKGIPAEKLIFYGLEYKFVTHYLAGTLGYDEMVMKLNIAIRQFSKRQMTYFRKMERDGLKIHWLDALDDPTKNVGEILKIVAWNR